MGSFIAVQVALVATAGFYSWGFVEYLVHGFLSHRWKTFVSPMHWGHHVDPRAVVTSPIAWVPVALAFFAVGWLLVGSLLAGAYMLGLLSGFARYERIHWRFHFREPRNPTERTLRSHHLAHHFRDPTQYHGVTTRRWDRIFGTFPDTWEADYAAVADSPILTGPSNFRETWNPRTTWRHFRESQANGARRR